MIPTFKGSMKKQEHTKEIEGSTREGEAKLVL
jgi:hypothetical protein